MTDVSEAEVEAAARAMKRSGDEIHEDLKNLARAALTAAAQVRAQARNAACDEAEAIFNPDQWGAAAERAAKRGAQAGLSDSTTDAGPAALGIRKGE